MKKKVLLIGGGTIATHYARGLKNSNTLSIVALADINPRCLAREVFDVPFFENYEQALCLMPDVALITVPAPNKIEIAKNLMRKGISVLMEKPVAISMSEIDSLIDCSRETGADMQCLFHWKKADEVMYLRRHLSDLGKIYSVKTTIFDDYAATPDLSVRPEKRGLLGAWYDSGINVLSYYDELFDLSLMKEASSSKVVDEKSKEVIFVDKEFMLGDTRLEIVVDWRTLSRQKTTVINCEAGELFVNHSEQFVSLDGQIIVSFPTDDRLASHYENLFANLCVENSCHEKMRFLHKLLLEEKV